MITRWIRWTILAVTIVVGIISRIRYIDWSIHDDVWISLRYARNLVRGEGLVMNPGERVEGITNLLWTLIAAPVLAGGGDAARALQILGGVAAVGLIAATYAFAVRRLESGWYALVTPILLAFNLAFVVESLSGLETLFFTALVFAAYVAFLEERRSGTARNGLWAVLCGAATVVRPEGALLFALLGGYAACGAVRGEPAAPLRRAVLLYAALVVPLILFRLAYYGVPVPNTFYAKVGYTLDQLARGWRYTRYALLFPLTLPVLGIAAAGPIANALARRRVARLPVRSVMGSPAPPVPDRRLFAGRPGEEAVVVSLLLVLGWAAYVCAIGGDYEPTQRFYMPVLPLVYLAFQEGLRSLAALVGGGARRFMVVAGLATAAFLGARSEHRILYLLEQRGWPHARRAHHEQLRAAGLWFRDHTAPGTTIALSSIGALAYFADRPVIDMMGLTDAQIGRRRMDTMGQGAAGHEKGDGDYVLSRKPDIILLDKGFLFPAEATVQEVLAGARGASEVEIVRDPRLADEYELLDTRIDAGILYWLQRKQ